MHRKIHSSSKHEVHVLWSGRDIPVGPKVKRGEVQPTKRRGFFQNVRTESSTLRAHLITVGRAQMLVWTYR
jgi:hypothetical protein